MKVDVKRIKGKGDEISTYIHKWLLGQVPWMLSSKVFDPNDKLALLMRENGRWNEKLVKISFDEWEVLCISLGGYDQKDRLVWVRSENGLYYV